MPTILQKKIANLENKIDKFIEDMRAMFSKTSDAGERANRLEVFDTLLILATYGEEEELENEFIRSLPDNEDDKTLEYMRQQLREINGFCKSSLSDNHEVYKDLYSCEPFPTDAKKESIRTMLSKAISTLIFEKTNTNMDCIELSSDGTSLRP